MSVIDVFFGMVICSLLLLYFIFTYNNFFGTIIALVCCCAVKKQTNKLHNLNYMVVNLKIIIRQSEEKYKNCSFFYLIRLRRCTQEPSESERDRGDVLKL